MEIKDLLKLYHSHKGNCCRCGCELRDNTGFGLGSIFVLDYYGNFYCANCDGNFIDGSEHIFEAEFYEDENEE